MTWYQLFNKIGKQPLYLTRHKDVIVKMPDSEYICKLVYTSGIDWHLEPIKKKE